MKRFLLFLLFSCAVSTSAVADSATDDAPRRIAITNVSIFDGTGDEAREGGTVLIEGETITVVSFGAVNLPDDTVVVDLAGHFLMPGLIDAHVHISHDSRVETEGALREALTGGVTSIRDMGGDARRLASLKRDAGLGEIAAPDIYYSAVFAGPTFFDDPRVIDVTRGQTPGATPWARAITAETDLERAVAEAKGAGATAVKIYTDLGADLITGVTTAAHAQGLLVWSHATVFPSRPGEIVEAGVDVISHSNGLYWEVSEDIPSAFGAHRDKLFEGGAAGRPEFRELFAAMHEHDTILEPTIFVIQHSSDHAPNDEEKARRSRRLEFANEITNLAYRNGVPIAAGSDNMIAEDDELPTIHEELRLLVENCGLSTAAALRAATSVNAMALGIADLAGFVQEGKRADLVVLSADPLADITNTRQIVLTVKRGELHFSP